MVNRSQEMEGNIVTVDYEENQSFIQVGGHAFVVKKLYRRIIV